MRAVEDVVGRDVDQVRVDLAAQLSQAAGQLGIQGVSAPVAVAPLGLGGVDVSPSGEVDDNIRPCCVEERSHPVTIEYVHFGVRWREQLEVGAPQLDRPRANEPRAAEHNQLFALVARHFAAAYAHVPEANHLFARPAGTQQLLVRPRQIAEMGCLILLLILILATLLAGPFGFVIALVLVVGWAVVTGSLRLLFSLLLLPLRILERLLSGR